MLTLPTGRSRQSEKRQPVPAGAVTATAIALSDVYCWFSKRNPFARTSTTIVRPFPAEHGSRLRQPTILLPVPSGRLDLLAANSEKVSRRDLPQVVLRDLVRPLASPLSEIAFRKCLQTPGDPPKQKSPMPDRASS
jgi:hypothetical protein